jgi:hypothetical protein
MERRETCVSGAARGNAGGTPVVELRRYQLHPGARETLIELFDREFVEPQEAIGIKVIGQFRSLGDPNCFVLLREFADMPTRARALASFYEGPVWARYGAEANAGIVESDDVLLLHPAWPGSGFTLAAERPPPAATTIAPGARRRDHLSPRPTDGRRLPSALRVGSRAGPYRHRSVASGGFRERARSRLVHRLRQ